MTIRLHGTANSRALRSIWAAEEIGVDYELVPTDFGPGSKTPEYLAINPNGRVPALVDGDLKLFESMAINLYLARIYGKGLYPSDSRDEAHAIQWSFWGMTELEPPLMQMVMHKFVLPDDQKDPAQIASAGETLKRPLAVLDAHLASRAHLLGAEFSIADLNVAGVFSMQGFVGYDPSPFAHVSRWYQACTARPSFERARKSGR